MADRSAGSGWDGSIADAPVQAAWAQVGEARHTLTPFDLDLTVFLADLPQNASRHRSAFHGANAFRPDDLPTLMRKAHDLAWAIKKGG
jgi:A/G-specific adenine glycosylase